MDSINPPMGHEPVLGLFPPYYLYMLLIIFLMAVIFYWLTRSVRNKETAQEILKKRYAKGEIDMESYRSMQKELAE